MNIRALLRDERGSAVTMFAFFLMVGVGFAALTIDGGYLYSLKNKLQVTADAAVLAAVGDLPDTDAARATAVDLATKNMSVAEHGTVLAEADVVTGNWDAGTRTFTPAGDPINAVRVVTRRSQGNGNAAGLFFARILGFDQVDIETEAIAVAGIAPVCLHSLEKKAAQAFKVNNGSAIAPGCGIHVNSTSNAAMVVPDGGVVDAAWICIVGDYVSTGTVSPQPETGCDPAPDPLAGLAPPPVGTCEHNSLSFDTGNHTLSPGVYCGGITVTGDADLDFEPGTYIMKGGELGVTGGTIRGDGVTVYFTGNARLKMAGEGSIHFSAPTSGDYAGILFFEDPNTAPGMKHGISGNGSVYYEGTIYFPNTELAFTGNGSGTSSSPYTVVIARLLKFAGNGSLTFNADYQNSNVPLPEQSKPKSAGLVR